MITKARRYKPWGLHSTLIELHAKRMDRALNPCRKVSLMSNRYHTWRLQRLEDRYNSVKYFK